MVPFVVLSTQRSGSTFLCRSLDEVPQLQCVGECFWWGSGIAFAKYAAHLQPGDPAQWPKRDRQRAVYGFLDCICADRPGLESTGFKLQYNQAEKFPEIFDWLHSRSARVIHLMRRNHLKRLVSWVIAQKCGQSTLTESKPQAKIRLACEDLISILEDLETQCEYYRHTLAEQFSCLEIFYHDFIMNRRKETKRIEDYLNVGSLGHLASSMVKVNSNDLRDIVVNYNDVVETLAGTRFARFLD